MSNMMPTHENADELLAKLVLEGDLSALSPRQKVEHYRMICERVGVDPATQPFDYLTLSGKMVLYAKKGCTDQLRQIHGISIEITDRRIEEGVYIVTAKATTGDGRADTDEGAVSMIYPDRHRVYRNGRSTWEDHPKAGQPLQGDDRANAILKAISKAKRRVTLSIVGLGMLDETEIETIPPDRVEVRSAEPRKPEQLPAAPPSPPPAANKGNGPGKPPPQGPTLKQFADEVSQIGMFLVERGYSESHTDVNEVLKTRARAKGWDEHPAKWPPNELAPALEWAREYARNREGIHSEAYRESIALLLETKDPGEVDAVADALKLRKDSEFNPGERDKLWNRVEDRREALDEAAGKAADG